jgi:acyl transferase domain-containing protein/phosphopantetheinyl transferase (holo-ACP synthase)
MTTSGNHRDAKPSAAKERDGIAIIGMSCLFPGAPDLDAYWRNILGGVDSITDPPPESWDPKLYYDPHSVATDRVYCKKGGYLGALAAFDPLEHGIPPVSVGGEPDQWLALRVARDAMYDAGYSQIDESVRRRTAVILGKGTYLNGGSGVAIQHGLIVTQTLEILKRLHPEYTEADLQALRQGLKDGLPPMGPEIVPGLIPNIIVGRIANRLDLMGPTYTVDAACASSLVAVQLALRDLRHGECDLALVGGSQVWMPVPTLGIFCQLGALSRRQQIRPFDKNADGTLLGEGIGMIVLKRLADAERDGDRVYSVIRGVGVASDGRGLSVMAPRLEGEELALERAYEDAEISPDTVELIEAHGTGTPVGDITEVRALSRIFGPRKGRLPRVALGSVKSMISHTIPAAGVAALIKVSLALHHKVLPPTLNCEEPNPKLELEKTPFYINTSTRPWLHVGPEPRRAGVNAFGFGGINSHVILEEHCPKETASRPTTDENRWPRGAAPDHRIPWDTEVCLFEAESLPALVQQTERWMSIVDELATASAAGKRDVDPHDLTDVAYSLARERIANRGQGCRLGLVATSLPDLLQKLTKARERLTSTKCRQIRDVSGIYYASEPLKREGRLAFVLPGEGAQYPNMLADLCLHFPEVRESYDQFDRLFERMGRDFLPSDYIFPRPSLPPQEREWTESLLWRIEGAIESVRVANLALYDLLQRLAVRPDVVVGHSSGEYAALQVTGILELKTEEELAELTRGLVKVHQAAFGSGIPAVALLALGAGRDDADAIVREIGSDVYVAMDNCPHQVVLVVPPEAVERVLAIVKSKGIIHEMLPFDRPYHTPLFSAYTKELQGLVNSFPLSPPRVPLYSCTSGDVFPDDPAGVRTLLVEHGIRPVEFRRTIERLHDEGVRLFVESGPRGNLTSFIEDTLRGRRFCAVPANVQRRSGVTQLNHLVGILASHGVDVDPTYLYRHRTPRLVELGRAGGTSTSSTRPGLEMKLTTGFPPMRLTEDHYQKLRVEASPTQTNGRLDSPSPLNAPTAVAAEAAEIPQAPSERSSKTDAPSIVVSSPPQPISTPSATAAQPNAPSQAQVASAQPNATMQPSDSMSSALHAFLKTMEHFLATQNSVVRDCLQVAPTPASSPAPADLDPVVNRVESKPTTHRLPLLGDVISFTDGKELIARRTFDPSSDLYLNDHSLGRVISDDDPNLRGLIVMPLTMSLEIVTEAAAALALDRVVIGLRDVRAYRWISFPDGPRTLQATARRQPGDDNRVQVELRNLTEEEQGDSARGPVVEAIVVFGDAYPPEPGKPLRAVEDGRPSSLRPDRLYSDVMFHGPRWQGVAAIDQTAGRGTTATLRVLPFGDFLHGSAATEFVLDPVTLDAAGQVIGFWTMEHLDTGQIVFPFRLEALDLFRPSAAAGESVTCTAAIDVTGERQIRSDIDVACADGRLWMRLTGWHDRRFDLPARFHPLILPSRQSELSEAWTDPLASLSLSDHFEIRRMAAAPPSDRGFWKHVWAQCILGRRERELFAQLTISEERQLAWLAGRTTAKEAVRRLLLRHAGFEARIADITIETDARGRLVADGTWRDQIEQPPLVSIGDAEGFAFAIASQPADELDRPRFLGIDARPIHSEPPTDAQPRLRGEARRLMANLSGDQQTEWMLRTVCAKQALLRAIDGDAEHSSISVSILSIDPTTGVVLARVEGDRTAIGAELNDSLLAIHTGRFDQWIVATTICDAAPAAMLTDGSNPRRKSTRHD